MSLKLAAIAATIYGLRSAGRHPRSINSHHKSMGTIGKGVTPQVDNLDSYSILANYNRALVKSNLK